MLSGRWVRGLNGSLSASWASSSLSFVFSGTILEILPGALTERKDQWNGGIPMIAIWTGKDENSITSNQPPWKVCDVEAGSGVILVQTMATSETYVRIMMIDWASVFEIGALLVDEGATIMLPRAEEVHRILYIGDSISCGYFDETGPTNLQTQHTHPRGCLDAFPYVAQRLLSQKNPLRETTADIVAYPGWTLIAPNEGEKSEGNPPGMLDGLFQVSPWNRDTHLYPESAATAIVFELGTNDQEYYPTERFKTSLQAFIYKLLDIMPSPPRYIWIIPPFPNGEDTSLRQEFPEIVSALRSDLSSIVEIEICDITGDLASEETIDGLHPSLDGHVKLGFRMAEFIEARL